MNYLIGFIRVKGADGASYGGDQNWFRERNRGKLADYGCGVVSLCDVIMYMAKHRKFKVNERFMEFSKVLSSPIIDRDEYLDYLCAMSKRFVPVFGWAKGTWGPALATGFNLFAIRYKIPYRARWAVKCEKMQECIAEMINQGIPVLFSVGAPFPKLWGKDGVTLYTKGRDGNFNRYGTANKHYMTITGYFELGVNEGMSRNSMENCCEKWIRVSSWGREFYIKWDEFYYFADKTSCPYFTNILYVYKKISV